jgi:spermidine/putrescine transport system permease protein
MKRLNARTFLVVPSWSVFTLIFAAPLAYFFLLSFWRVKFGRPVADFTFSNYTNVINTYGNSISFTFWVAFAIASIVTVLAFAFAYYVRFFATKRADLLLFLAMVTLFGGYLTKIYVWKTILGEGGVLNSGLLALGIIDQPFMAFLYNPVAVVITLVHYTLPLAILPIYGSLRAVADTPLQCARDLGASRARVFWDIVLPQCRTGIVTAFALTYLFAAGDYVTPQLVGGPYTSMIGSLIQLQFGFRLNAPMGSALAFTMIAIAAITIGTLALTLRQILKVRT